MVKLNNIFGNLSDIDFEFPLDFTTVASNLRDVKSNHHSDSDHKLIYGENVQYDYNLSDNSSELDLNSNRVSYTVIDIDTQTKTIGYHNTKRLFTGRGNDTIVGLGNATITGDFQAIARGESNTIDGASADSTAKAIFEAQVEAIGIRNDSDKAILTAKGNDTIVGLSDVRSNVSAISEATAIDLSLAKADSQSTVVIDVLAIGVENEGRIVTGQGTDLVIGAANSSTQIDVRATALANALDLNLSHALTEELNNANSESNSISEAIDLATTLGIANSGNIFLNGGNDTIYGLAVSQNAVDAVSDSQTASNSDRIALAKANAEAVAVVENFTIGITNRGHIATGWGNDVVTGLAFNQSQANAEADAQANAQTDITDANTNTRAIADTGKITAIGIDNSSGLINTGVGADRIVAYGSDTGLVGGRINTGENNDRVQVYGAVVGVESAVIDLGRGHDYFQAEVADLDPLTGEIDLADNQANSIRDAKVYGNLGNDTFELGGFDGAVLIHGGKDFDTLRLSGDLDSYKIGVSSSSAQTLTIEDSGSTLTVKSVEAIYFGDSEQYSVSDFA